MLVLRPAINAVNRAAEKQQKAVQFQVRPAEDVWFQQQLRISPDAQSGADLKTQTMPLFPSPPKNDHVWQN